MITKEQYLEALTIVETYHKQLNLSIVRHCGNDNDISKLKKCDYVRFAKEDWRTGETYLYALNIKHDNDGSYWIPVTNTYKMWSCA